MSVMNETNRTGNDERREKSKRSRSNWRRSESAHRLVNGRNFGIPFGVGFEFGIFGSNIVNTRRKGFIEVSVIV